MKYFSKEMDSGLTNLIEGFSEEMEIKLHEMFDEGYCGWDDVNNFSEFWYKLKDHVEKGPTDPKDLINIANLAAFLWNMTKDAVELGIWTPEQDEQD